MSVELFERADKMLGQANGLLEASVDSRVRIETNCVFDLANDFSVELREIVDSLENPEGWPSANTASLYIYRKPDPVTGEHSHSPDLFFDVFDLMNGKYRGSNNKGLERSELTSRIHPDSQIHALLSTAFTATELDSLDLDWPQSKINELVEFFRLLLTGGGEVRTEEVHQKLPDDSSLLIKSVKITGTLPTGIYTFARQLPQQMVARDEKPVRYQLERHGQTLESFTRPSNGLEYQAMYAAPEMVHRNEEGEIIGVSNVGDRKTALIEAERAAGLRDLKGEVLDRIEEGLGLWVVKNTEL